MPGRGGGGGGALCLEFFVQRVNVLAVAVMRIHDWTCQILIISINTEPNLWNLLSVQLGSGSKIQHNIFMHADRHTLKQTQRPVRNFRRCSEH